MNKRYLTLYPALVLISSCSQKSNDNHKPNSEWIQKKTDSVSIRTKENLADSLIVKKDNVSASSQKDGAEEWLKSLFKTKDSDQYFPEYNVEEKLCTKRFKKFIAESGEIYGPSNLTDAEYPAAEKKYKAKWSKIYPIEEREMWLFGRGNGDIGELKDLKISKIKEGLYQVFIDYGDGIKTQNEITLVSENGNYKIDYCKTEFLE